MENIFNLKIFSIWLEEINSLQGIVDFLYAKNGR